MAAASRDLIVHGRSVEKTWIDEAGDFNSHAVDAFGYMVNAPQRKWWSMSGGSPVTMDQQAVDHLEVPCSHCGAQPGQACRRMASYDEAAFGGYHITRDHDAKLVSEAARAMGAR